MAMTAWALKGAARRGITNKEMLRKESTCDSEGDLDFTETLSEGIFVIDNSSTLPNERDACSTQWERSSLQMPLLWGAQLQFCLRTEARARERERENKKNEKPGGNVEGAALTPLTGRATSTFPARYLTRGGSSSISTIGGDDDSETAREFPSDAFRAKSFHSSLFSKSEGC